MPITIQEIIASDTISQLVDKTNFNFDQLLLNGGGPPGPIGLPGPTGPAGGRGPKGSTWYEDASLTTPGVSPNVTAPTVTPLSGDYYLQFNGQVWEYNGTTWVITTVDLQGPAGPSGTTGGFGSFFGQGSISNFNTVLPTPKGIGGTGANLSNEGILSVLVGGAASNTDTADSGVTLTSAYQLTDALALSMASDIVSLMVHQKNTGSRALVFHGGADSTNSENMEQNSLGALSGIKLENDDRLTVDVPKLATIVPGMSNADVIGYQVITSQRSQSYSSGNQIIMSSGNNAAPYGFANENSNIEITVNTGSSGGTGNKFKLVTTGSAGSGIFEIGNNVLINQAPQIAANINANAALTAGYIDLVSSQVGKIQLLSGGGVSINTASNAPFTGNIDVASGTGGLNLSSTGLVSMIVKGTANANTLTIQNQYNGANNATGQLYILGNKDIALRKTTASASNAPSIVLNYTNSTAPHTRFVGHQTWTKVGTASQAPIAATLEKYNNLEGVGSTASAMYELTGRNSLVDMTPGFTLNQWEGGIQSISNVPAGIVKIDLGKEGPTSPVVPGFVNPLSYTMQARTEMFNNSLGIAIEHTPFGALHPYESFRANSNQTRFSGPLVKSQTVNPNSTFMTGGSVTATQNYCSTISPIPPTTDGFWGFNTATAQGLTSPSAVGMPGTAELAKNASHYNLVFGPGFGPVFGSAGVLNQNINYDYRFTFPTGAYPGQEVTLSLQHFTQKSVYNSNNQTIAGACAAGSFTREFSGDITIQIPTSRWKRTSALWNFNDWTNSARSVTYKFKASNPNIGSYIPLATNQTLRMRWNGTINTTGGTDPTVFPYTFASTDVQWGWEILSVGVETVAQVSFS